MKLELEFVPEIPPTAAQARRAELIRQLRERPNEWAVWRQSTTGTHTKYESAALSRAGMYMARRLNQTLTDGQVEYRMRQGVVYMRFVPSEK